MQTFKDMLYNGIQEVDPLQSKSKQLVEKNLTTSQMRKFFGALKKIDADFEKLNSEIVLLEPQLAYAVGRAKDREREGIKLLYETLAPLIREVQNDKARFKNLVKIVEAIVAYHKFYNGKD